MGNTPNNNRSSAAIRVMRLALFAACLCLTQSVMANGWGVPFFRNHTAKEYGAHNRNYDVACDDNGTLFVANFEGLLYFDGASWRKIHTPGVSRVTRLAKGENGRIWVGGYNVFGFLEADKQGRLKLHAIASDTDKKKISEVNFIKVTKDQVLVSTTSNKTYSVSSDNKLVQLKGEHKQSFDNANDSVASLSLPGNIRINYNNIDGIRISRYSSTWMPLTEADGLTSNIINYITFDKRFSIWGATMHGIFEIDATSPYSHFNENQGLKGGVNCINQIGNTIFIGTLEGLFSFKDTKIKKVDGVNLSCWQLIHVSPQEMIAATTIGLFRITENGAQKINDRNVFSVVYDNVHNCYITGEANGIFMNGKDGTRKQLSSREKITKLTIKGNNLIAESIYGEVWQIDIQRKIAPKRLKKSSDIDTPRLSYTDADGRIWKTDYAGNNLTVSGSGIDEAKKAWLHPLRNRTLDAIFVDNDNKLWVGGDFGVIVGDMKDMTKNLMPELERPFIRQVSIMGDSVVWGGYNPDGLTPLHVIDDLSLPSGCNRITIYFSSKTNSAFCPTKYRYRINNGTWSSWSDETQVKFNNIVYGPMKVDIQALDMFGRESEISTADLYVAFPFFLRWWAMLIYIALLVLLVMAFMQWRTKRLEKEKAKLEATVAERTAELSTTLNELRETQDNLVRMERTATAGKLTQGLIDRILNPINYINNFSHLTIGLAKDLREDIDDEKEAMSTDNYEDCEDILDMMTQNLQKIEQHGVNTTRTLRAMEALLNNHVGALTSQDILPLCHQVVAVVSEYHKAEIEQCGIKITTDMPSEPVVVNMDAESLNKVLLSIFTNSIYAVAKKFSQSPYNPEIIFTVKKSDDGKTVLSLRDNGIGIEDTIKEKVFDPFFTTKPTGEAAGVGLYLAREIVNEHKATITMESEKNEYCEFIITFG